MAAPPVPAWKRFLKLKSDNATDSAGGQSSQPQPTPPCSLPPTYPTPTARNLDQQQKRRLEALDQAAPETPAKRPRPNRQQHPIVAAEEEERSSLPAPTGIFKAPNQKPKRTVFGDDE